MAAPGYSASGGNAGPATSGANGSVTGNNYAGNGLTINKAKTPTMMWVALIVMAIVLLLAVI